MSGVVNRSNAIAVAQRLLDNRYIQVATNKSAPFVDETPGSLTSGGSGISNTIDNSNSDKELTGSSGGGGGRTYRSGFNHEGNAGGLGKSSNSLFPSSSSECI
eukprot:Pgem_evm1s10434